MQDYPLPTIAKKKKLIRHWQVFTVTVVLNTISIWAKLESSHSAEAAPLYDKFTTYVQNGACSFLAAVSTGAGGTATTTIGPLVKSFLGLIPWAVILLVGAVVAWQAYEGYRAYDREDVSGAGQAILKVLVILFLTVMSSAVTDFFVGGGAATAATTPATAGC
jgi:hypothetical protein